MSTVREYTFALLDMVAVDFPALTAEMRVVYAQRQFDQYWGEELGAVPKSVELGKHGRRLAPELQQRVYADALSSMSTPEILRKHGISRATLYRLTKKAPAKT